MVELDAVGADLDRLAISTFTTRILVDPVVRPNVLGGGITSSYPKVVSYKNFG